MTERQAEIVAQLRELFTGVLTKAMPLLAELDGKGGTLLDQYIDTCLHRREGEKVAFSDFYSRFKSWLPERECENWPKGRVLQELREPLKVRNEGRSDQPRRMIEGLSWQPAPPPPEPAKVEPAKPLNPDYDEAMMCQLIKRLLAEGFTPLDKTAKKLNELGHRDKYGKPWSKDTAAALHFDSPY